MKIFLLVAFFLVLANVLSQEMHFDYNWRTFTEKSIRPQSEPYYEILKRTTRKPGSRQYVRLMRNRAKAQITSRRQRFESFVGLMGKRSSKEPGPFRYPQEVTLHWKNTSL